MGQTMPLAKQININGKKSLGDKYGAIVTMIYPYIIYPIVSNEA